jgi:glyoxylase I family protein
MIKNIEHTAILAINPTELVQWYCDTLGFEIIHAIEENGQYFITLPGGGMLEFLKANDKDRGDQALNDAGIRHIAFTVENYDDVVRELENKGVTFTNPSHDVPPPEGGKRNFFPDPENNILQLISRPKPLCT